MDKRSNPRIPNQNWVEMRYIDNESMQRKLRIFVKGKFSVYLFCGQENYCMLNVDADPRSKANLVMEALTFLESLQDNSVDIFIFDPLFVFIDDEAMDSEGKIKDGFYNANERAWEKAARLRVADPSAPERFPILRPPRSNGNYGKMPDIRFRNNSS